MQEVHVAFAQRSLDEAGSGVSESTLTECPQANFHSLPRGAVGKEPGWLLRAVSSAAPGCTLLQVVLRAESQRDGHLGAGGRYVPHWPPSIRPTHAPAPGSR